MNTETTRSLQEEPDASTAQPPRKFVVWLWRQARRVVIFVIGSTVLLIGIAMIVLPGPAIVVIPLGLAILATEFVWARRWLEFAKRQVETIAARASDHSRTSGDPDVKNDRGH